MNRTTTMKTLREKIEAALPKIEQDQKAGRLSSLGDRITALIIAIGNMYRRYAHQEEAIRIIAAVEMAIREYYLHARFRHYSQSLVVDLSEHRAPEQPHIEPSPTLTPHTESPSQLNIDTLFDEPIKRPVGRPKQPTTLEKLKKLREEL